MLESPLSPTLQQLIATLSDLGLTGQEIAEAIWLAAQTSDRDDRPIDITAQTITEEVDDPEQVTRPPRLSAADDESAADSRPPIPPTAEIIPAPGEKLPSLALPPSYKPIPIPDAPAISQALQLARALRPLARQIAIGLPTILDEEATVDQIAETGVWQPILKPESELWLDVALVFDRSPSMCLWQRLGNDVLRLLSRYGEFRDVRIWWLEHREGQVELTTRRGVPCSPKKLLVGDRRRLVVVVSDCVASAWHNGAMQKLIKVWAEKLPTVVFHVFPERLWARTALARSVTVEFQARQPGVANEHLQPLARSVWDRERLQTSLGRSHIRLPVVSLEADALASWADVVVGDRRSRVLGIVWDKTAVGQLTGGAANSANVSMKERIDAFVLTASPISRELAARLASAPVITLPIARIIQGSMRSTANAVHLAEVLMSGLFKVSGTQVPSFKNAEKVVYELVDEMVRDRLRAGTRVVDALDVFEQVSDYVARGLGKSVHEFWALLRVPGSGQSSAETEFLQAFAKVSANILRGLGGEFATIANALAPAAREDQELEIDNFPLEDLEYEVAKFINFPTLQPCEYEAATITAILDRFEFETATIERRRKGRSEWQIQRHGGSNWGYTETLSRETGEDVSLDMMAIPGGSFTMGAPKGEVGSGDRERPQHQVTLPPFYLGCYLVTQAQWRIVAGYPQIERELDPDPSDFKGDNRPVENVDWDDAQEFCRRLSAKTGKDYRLPSEAQWEYACRSGTTTPFHFGEMITPEVANYNGNATYNNGPKGEYRKQTTEVGRFPANEWGLYDMHGNVWEWCEDDWHDSYAGAPNDGSAWVESDRESTRRLLRGGCWNDLPDDCRSAVRDGSSRDNRLNYLGFRVSCVPPRTDS